MFCSKCGKENPGNVGFCSACGSVLSLVAQKEATKPWSDNVMNVLLFGTGLLPIIGIVAGLIGIFKPAVKAQGIILLAFGIGTAVMFGLATPVGGLIFGLGFACVLVFMPQKSCPDCGTALPKFRMPQKGQVLRGGWICPNCGCEIDRKGNKIKSGLNVTEASGKILLQHPVDTLHQKRRVRVIWGWILLVPGVLMIFVMLLTYFFPGRDSSGEVSELSLGNMLWASGFVILFFLAPGLFLLSRAKRIPKKIQTKSRLTS
jgi:hypothetical protein